MKTSMTRSWWHLIVAACFIANSISLFMGGTAPTFPDIRVWITCAIITAALCVGFVAHPSPRMAAWATMAILVASGTRAVGAIGYNPTTWSKFGGGSIWTLVFVFALQAHLTRRRVHAFRGIVS
jgi:hypothetical protein